ncbi:hypothetical protein IWQ60_010844 [Tieghemiomyces parasiticus]|uniref:Nodulin-like domain-containing protein n=1 Tax=Tieghemiomyces parasiticus TaxID=78921 RepID=A0A9W7ZPI3_9FUNG|nr:hypothetical protein IWQ60_010844 [Tieghemiomyces parasiticus]
MRRTTQVTVAYLVGCLSMLGAGTVYLFSLYGPAFNAVLHFSSSQTNVVASAGDYGLYLSGPVCGALVDRLGPRPPAFLGGGLLLVGYSLLAHLFNHVPADTDDASPHTVALAAFAFALVGMGSQAAYMAAMSATARNFARHRGLALGTAIGLFGLSAFFFSQMHRLPVLHEEARFLAFLAAATSGAHFIAATGLRVVPPASPEVIDVPSEAARLIGPVDLVTPVAPVPRALNPASQRTFFRDPQALYLFLGLFGVTGAGLMFINNIGTVIDTLAATDAAPAATLQLRTHIVSLLSLSNFGSRVLSGQTSDVLLRRHGLPRIALLLTAAVVMLFSQLGVTHLTSTTGLYLLTVLIGSAYGTVFALGPTVTSEYWGNAHLGYHWGWLVLAPAIGGHTCNTLFGLVYDAHAPAGTPVCTGAHCFQNSFRITAGLCLFSAIALARLLVLRFRVLKAQ